MFDPKLKVVQTGCNGVLIGQNCDLLIDIDSLPNIPIGGGSFEPIQTGCNGVLIGQNCDHLIDIASLPNIPIGFGAVHERSLKLRIE